MKKPKRRKSNRTSSAELSRCFRRAINGEEGALQTLLTHYRALLLSLAASRLDARLRVKAAPSDMVQNTIWKATQAFVPANFESRGKFLAWLITILDNEAANVRRRYLRAQKRDVRRERSLNCPNSDGSLRQLSARISTAQVGIELAAHRTGLLEAAIVRLPKHYQLVLRLRYAEAKSFAEIAEQLECSYDGARMLCQRALQRTKNELQTLDPESGN